MGTPAVDMARTKTKKRKKTGVNWHQPVKHHHAAVALTAAVLVVAVALIGAFTKAADDRYRFVARGVITEIEDDKSLHISISHITGNGVDDLRGVNRLFKTVSTTKYYKVSAGKDKPVKVTNVAVGQEVGFKGIAKDDGSYVVTWLRIHDRAFTIVGKLKGVDRSLKWYKVAVTTSTYRPGTYDGTDVIINYGGNTVFQTNTGVSREADEVKAESQTAKITGTVGDHNRWEMTKLIDGYTGK